MSTCETGQAASAEPTDGWVARRWFTPSGAAVAELRPDVEAMQVFQRLAGGSHAIFLDSAQTDAGAPATGPRLGRHSFVAADPIHSVRVEPAEAARIPQALASLRGLLADLACATIPGLPPFQGGVAGLVSYDCGRERLGVATTAQAAAAVPLLSLHVYDVVCGFDHDLGRGWIISQGVPAKGPIARRARATERLESLLARLSAPPRGAAAPSVTAALPTGAIHPLPGHDGVFSNHTRES
jgi:para-aminobenzoate synthetase component 1